MIASDMYSAMMPSIPPMERQLSPEEVMAHLNLDSLLGLNALGILPFPAAWQAPTASEEQIDPVDPVDQEDLVAEALVELRAKEWDFAAETLVQLRADNLAAAASNFIPQAESQEKAKKKAKKYVELKYACYLCEGERLRTPGPLSAPNLLTPQRRKCKFSQLTICSRHGCQQRQAKVHSEWEWNKLRAKSRETYRLVYGVEPNF